MCNDLDFMFKPIVLVTGFGPFCGHPENASWEGVKRMNKEEIEKKHNIELVLLVEMGWNRNIQHYAPPPYQPH